MSPSYYHGYYAVKISTALDKLNRFDIISELTIDIHGTPYIPDISLYPLRSQHNPVEDTTKMTEMPLLAVELLSPTQIIQEIIDKFKIYFEAGIKSCWLVIPLAKTILVFSAIKTYQTFMGDELVDTNLDIKIPLREIFV